MSRVRGWRPKCAEFAMVCTIWGEFSAPREKCGCLATNYDQSHRAWSWLAAWPQPHLLPKRPQRLCWHARLHSCATTHPVRLCNSCNRPPQKRGLVFKPEERRILILLVVKTAYIHL